MKKNAWRYHFTLVYHKLKSWCIVSEIWSTADRICSHFGSFFALLPPKQPENQNFEKMKKIQGDIIISHTCAINESHMIYGSWDMEHNRQIFFLFWTIFYPFLPQQPRKSKFWKNEKSIWTCHHFTHVYNK